MQFAMLIFRRPAVAFAILLGVFGTLGVAPSRLAAADKPGMNQSGSGTFVSYLDGTLTLNGKSGRLVYERVGENYKTYQNNEDGPGSKLVPTVRALSGEQLEGKLPSLTRVLPGTVVRVDVEAREIHFGSDHRVIGAFMSYQDGKLNLRAAEAPKGFVTKPVGDLSLRIDPATPVLESVAGGDYKFVGLAEKVFQTTKPGATITARSEYDPDIIEVVQIGVPKRQFERYIGESRGPVRGTFVSFKDGILRIRGKGLNAYAVGDYERVIARRIGDDIPIVESIDGGEYRPVSLDTLGTLKEGEIVTIRKVENVVLEIQIGVPKQK